MINLLKRDCKDKAASCHCQDRRAVPPEWAPAQAYTSTTAYLHVELYRFMTF